MSTILHRLARWAEVSPKDIAQRYKKNGKWRDISARQYCDRVYYLALYLRSRGMNPSDIGCILSPNCPQWTHTDLAAILLGAKSAGLYPNSISKDISYVLNHTDCRFLAVQGKDFFEKIPEGDRGRFESVLAFDDDVSISPKAVAYTMAIEEGRRIAQSGQAPSLGDLLAKLDPEAGVFMIYTSGTTGSPKGALLSNDNFVFTSDVVSHYWKLPDSGALFSFLPLCHVAEKIQSIGVGISKRYTVGFCTKFESVSAELPEIEPTLLLCVPRLWEKMMEGVLNKVNRAEGLKKRLAQWALGVGARAAEARYASRAPSVLDLIQLPAAEKLVLSKVKKALGLGRAELLASGAAALPPHVSRWFRSLGLEILEDFGQTESTGVICMTEPGVDSAGTVGKPVPGLDVKLAPDGEILTRGRHVFKGYYKDEAATRQALEGGWLHTGDLGEIDSRGLMRIKGRKKEVLKTSGGKMVAPLPIEERLKSSPWISQVCMVGDGRKYLAALITLSETAVEELSSRKADLTQPLVTDPQAYGAVKSAIDQLNRELASYEQVKKFAILPREFSIVDGEMTPTLKMKRNIIENRYRSVIDQMYADARE